MPKECTQHERRPAAIDQRVRRRTQPDRIRRQSAAAIALWRARSASRPYRTPARRVIGAARQPAGDRRAGLGDRGRAARVVAALRAVGARPRDRPRGGRGRVAPSAGRNRGQKPQPVAGGCRLSHPQAAHRTALGRPGGLCQGNARARAGVRARAGRHRQDLSRRRRGDRSADGRPSRTGHPVAAGGRGRRAARLSARRPARQGRSLPAADFRCTQ